MFHSGWRWGGYKRRQLGLGPLYLPQLNLLMHCRQPGKHEPSIMRQTRRCRHPSFRLQAAALPAWCCCAKALARVSGLRTRSLSIRNSHSWPKQTQLGAQSRERGGKGSLRVRHISVL